MIKKKKVTKYKKFAELIVKDVFVVKVLTITIVIVLVMAIIHKNVKNNHNVSKKQQIIFKKEIKLPSQGPFQIVRVIDGDTIIIDNGRKVRLIGIDAPEIHHPEIPVQRFAKEAADYLNQIAKGQKCMLEYEPGNVEDRYGRLLAYVFINGRNINAEMIQRGYAFVYTRFPFNRMDEFIFLEQEARRKQYGLWYLTLRDGRIANLTTKYETLNLEGRRKLDEILDELIKKYPFEKIKKR